MNLSELSKLVKVTQHLKSVIESAGYTKFSNATLTALKKRLSEFDEVFISEMLSYDDRNSSKAIHDAVTEARQKMGLEKGLKVENKEMASLRTDLQALRSMSSSERTEAGAAINKKVTARRNAMPVDPDKQHDSQQDKDQSVETKEQVVEVKEEVKELPRATAPSVNQPYLQDESLAALLAAEKRKVAAKKK